MKTKTVAWERFLKVEKDAKAALNLASVHDPDLLRRIEVLERQMERLGAPQYRVLKKGKK